MSLHGDFPELQDYSLVDKNASMSVVINRIKPEVSITVILRFLLTPNWPLVTVRVDFYKQLFGLSVCS